MQSKPKARRLMVNRCSQSNAKMQGARVLILTGRYKGEQGGTFAEHRPPDQKSYAAGSAN
jgi:hypothetical protein